MLSAIRRLFGLSPRLSTYDEQTLEVMRRVLRADSVTVDVGAHVGSVLRDLMRCAPRGQHFAFEPIPACYEKLRKRLHRNMSVQVYPYALAAESGSTTFQHVLSRPTYSGLKRRRYEREEEVMEITVECARLDDIIPAATTVDFVKIDVEGGEYGVLRGGVETLRRCAPVVVFEHGIGGADHYGTEPEHVYDLLHDECGLKLSLMTSYLAGLPPLDRAAFCDEFRSHRNYYFMAYPAGPAMTRPLNAS